VRKSISPGQLHFDFEAAAELKKTQDIQARINAIPLQMVQPSPYACGDVVTKPTWYRGVWFDSRVEAKYAMAWDLLGIRYKIEEEKFTDYNGKGFIPDFYLPDHRLWVEVTNDSPEAQARKVPRCQALADLTGQAVFLTKGFPPAEAEHPLCHGWGFYLPHPHTLNKATVAQHFPDLLRLKEIDADSQATSFAQARKARFEKA